MLLRAGAHVEARDVDQLPPHADVALADEDAGVVDALGEALLEDLGLEAALEELLGGELQHEVELELVLGEEAVAVHATEESGTLEDALGVLGIEGEEGAGCLAELREGVLDAPDLALAPEAILPHELELGVEALLLEGTTGGLVCLPVVPVLGVRWHGLSSIEFYPTIGNGIRLRIDKIRELGRGVSGLLLLRKHAEMALSRAVGCTRRVACARFAVTAYYFALLEENTDSIVE